jgi:hypothetical protein
MTTNFINIHQQDCRRSLPQAIEVNQSDLEKYQHTNSSCYVVEDVNGTRMTLWRKMTWTKKHDFDGILSSIPVRIRVKEGVNLDDPEVRDYIAKQMATQMQAYTAQPKKVKAPQKVDRHLSVDRNFYDIVNDIKAGKKANHAARYLTSLEVLEITGLPKKTYEQMEDPAERVQVQNLPIAGKKKKQTRNKKDDAKSQRKSHLAKKYSDNLKAKLQKVDEDDKAEDATTTCCLVVFMYQVCYRLFH